MQMQPNNRRQEMFQQSRLPHCVSLDLAFSDVVGLTDDVGS
jgi:hypothetical protein